MVVPHKYSANVKNDFASETSDGKKYLKFVGCGHRAGCGVKIFSARLEKVAALEARQKLT
jgi:hypothetical protein